MPGNAGSPKVAVICFFCGKRRDFDLSDAEGKAAYVRQHGAGRCAA